MQTRICKRNGLSSQRANKYIQTNKKTKVAKPPEVAVFNMTPTSYLIPRERQINKKSGNLCTHMKNNISETGCV